jgi:Protein of unknown function (DUF3455)
MIKQFSPHSQRFLKAAALALSALAMPIHADGLRLPILPSGSPLIVTSADGSLFRIGHAVGTQQYVCKSSVDSLGVTSYGWTLFGPQATLFKNAGLTEQSMTHFQSPNLVPEGNPPVVGVPRPTWQDSGDTSAVWAQPPVPYVPAVAAPACDHDGNASTPAIASIPLLKLVVDGDPNGSIGKLTGTKFIQRLNTCGGVAPATGCTTATDVGKKALVPYAADYYFYR